MLTDRPIDQFPKRTWFTIYWLAWAALAVAAWFVGYWLVPVVILLFALGEAPGVLFGNGRSLSSKFWSALGRGKYSDRKGWAEGAIVYIVFMVLGAGLAYMGYDAQWCKIAALVGVLLGLADWLRKHWTENYGSKG